MKAGKGKRKGNIFENQTAKTLSLWLTGGEDKTQLISSRQSGGWAEKGGPSQAWRQVGDLAPNGERGAWFRRRFVVECKHHKEIQFWHWWTASAGTNILGWWEKLVEEIKAEGPTDRPPAPLLVFRMNYRPIMVATRPGVIHHVLEEDQTSPRARLEGHGVALGIMSLDDFLRQEPETLAAMVEDAWRVT